MSRSYSGLKDVKEEGPTGFGYFLMVQDRNENMFNLSFIVLRINFVIRFKSFKSESIVVSSLCLHEDIMHELMQKYTADTDLDRFLASPSRLSHLQFKDSSYLSCFMKCIWCVAGDFLKTVSKRRLKSVFFTPRCWLSMQTSSLWAFPVSASSRESQSSEWRGLHARSSASMIPTILYLYDAVASWFTTFSPSSSSVVCTIFFSFRLKSILCCRNEISPWSKWSASIHTALIFYSTPFLVNAPHPSVIRSFGLAEFSRILYGSNSFRDLDCNEPIQLQV